jgi:hypothetical protein
MEWINNLDFGELLNAIIDLVGYVHVACRIYRHSGWAI